MQVPTYSERPANVIHNGLRQGSVNNQSGTVRAAVSQIARSTDNFANQILAETQSSGKTVVHHHHYGYSYGPSFWWYYPQPLIFVEGGNSNNDAGQARFLIGLVAMVVGGIALFATGSAIGRMQESKKDLDDSQQDMAKLQGYARNAQANEQNLVGEALAATSLKTRICKRIKDSAIMDLAFRVTMLVGCGLLLTGALVTYPAQFFLAGTVATVTSGGAMLFKWGLDNSDKQNARDAASIRASVQLLSSL